MQKIVLLFMVVVAFVSCSGISQGDKTLLPHKEAYTGGSENVISYTPKIEAYVSLPGGETVPVNFTTITGFSFEKENNKRSMRFPHLAVEALELLAIIYLLFRGRWASDERIKEVTANSQRLEEKFVLKSDYYAGKNNQAKISELSQKVVELQKMTEFLSKQCGGVRGEIDYDKIVRAVVLELERTGLIEAKGRKENDGAGLEAGQTASFQYVKNFRDGYMNPCSQNEAQFRLSMKGDGVSSFEFCGDFETAKANVDGTFDGVCKIEGGIDGSSKITTVSMGEATLQPNGKWKVSKPAIVKFV